MTFLDNILARKGACISCQLMLLIFIDLISRMQIYATKSWTTAKGNRSWIQVRTGTFVWKPAGWPMDALIFPCDVCVNGEYAVTIDTCRTCFQMTKFAKLRL